MLRTKIAFITLLIALTVRPVLGLDSLAHKMSVYTGYHRGFLIAHRPLIAPLQQDKINGFEIALTSQTSGSKAWHHIYGFPEIGLSLSLWDLGNEEMLGKSVALIPFIDFPVSEGKRHSLDLKFGWGAGYVEKGFDPDDNYKNVAVGTKLNVALILQPHFKIHLSNRVSLSGGISLTHYSNGSMATPNLGLNIASVTGGISWRFDDAVRIPEQVKPSEKISNRTTVFGSLSSKQIYPANGPSFLAASVSGNRSWQVTHKSAFGAGADIFYDHSILTKIKNKENREPETNEAFRGGIHGSYELVIADLSIMINMGGYLYSKSEDGLFYHRVGLRYQVTPKLFACVNVKSHWGKADCIEWGIGWRIGDR